LGCNYRRSVANHELDYEINAHNVDQDEEEDLDEWFEANAMNQRDPKTGRCLGVPDSRRPKTTSAKQIKCKAISPEPS